MDNRRHLWKGQMLEKGAYILLLQRFFWLAANCTFLSKIGAFGKCYCLGCKVANKRNLRSKRRLAYTSPWNTFPWDTFPWNTSHGIYALGIKTRNFLVQKYFENVFIVFKNGKNKYFQNRLSMKALISSDK